jgi:membrane-associated protease RseP (regulator of RpoE activity)
MSIARISGIIFVIASLGLSPLCAQGEESTSEEFSPDVQSSGWLGVWVKPLPRALDAQLAHIIKSGEGLMVVRVENNSPAQLTGMQRYDVLLTLNGQQLYTPAQLSRLAQNYAGSNQLELEIIRKGELKILSTILSSKGKRTIAKTRRYPPVVTNTPAPFYPPMQRLPMLSPPENDFSVWDHFESVEIKTLPLGRHHVTVSFGDVNNETQIVLLEGRKQEIMQQIQQLEEFPEEKKHALLKALKLQPKQMNRFDPYSFTRNQFGAPQWQQPAYAPPYSRNPYFTHGFDADPYRGSAYGQPWQLHLYPDARDWNHRPDSNYQR